MSVEGATLWARKTLESDIFLFKPAVWFKIWFFIVSRANFKDNGRYKRGELFTTYKEIQSYTRATNDQIKHCVEALKHASMIHTQKATRGFYITIINYNTYQNIYTYKSHTKSHTKATGTPHTSHTIGEECKNEECKNDNNINTTIAFDFEKREFSGITDKDLQQWSEAYPAVDIPLDIKRATLWLVGNPTKAKKQYRRFLTNWFSRTQERGGNRKEKNERKQTPASKRATQEAPVGNFGFDPNPDWFNSEVISTDDH